MTISCPDCSWFGERESLSSGGDFRCPLCDTLIELPSETTVDAFPNTNNSPSDIDFDFMKAPAGVIKVSADAEHQLDLEEIGLLPVGVKFPALPKKRKLKSLGQYKILKKIGEGAMGRVYLAEDTLLLRQVAIKVLPKELAQDAELLSRFKREARASGELNHENIAGAFACDEEHGLNYLVMEYCDGKNLASVLKEKKYLSWKHATKIVLDIAQGLKCAHDHGLIHRDIKPSNIMITKTGVAKVLDLGLVKFLTPDASTSFRTVSGMAVGTPYYISPEQAQAFKNVDGRTDIYALGATFYHLVTGRPPFTASSTTGVLLKHLDDEIPNPQDIQADVPDGIADIIQITMNKDPEDRYADCAELIEDLNVVLNGQAFSSDRIMVGKSSVATSQVRRNPGYGVARKDSGLDDSDPELEDSDHDWTDSEMEQDVNSLGWKWIYLAVGVVAILVAAVMARGL